MELAREWNKQIRDGNDGGNPTATLPYHQRDWIDVEPGRFDKNSTDVSKQMTRLLRHDRTVLRDEDGAVEFRILASMFHSKFTSSLYWSIRTWLNFLQRGGGPKKRFQFCVDPHAAEDCSVLSSNSRSFWRKTH